MTALPAVFQWAHVLSASLWLGQLVFVYVVFYPRITPERSVWATESVLAVASRVSPILLVVVIVTGVVRGIAFGPIAGVSALAANWYGLTWAGSVAAGVALLAVDVFALRPRVAAGDLPGLRLPVLVELGLALVLLAAMVLMRFGL